MLPINRNVLVDEPASEDSFQGRGHDRTAEALASAIGLFHDHDRAIGLDGRWGSGKSSIVEIAKQKLSTMPDARVTYHFFTYDIWKSQGSSFRRSFLEHLLAWAKSEFPKQRTNLQKISKKVKGKTRTIDTKNQNILDWYGIIVILFIPFLPIYYFWSKNVFDGLEKVNRESDFFRSAPFLGILAFILLTFLWAGKKYLKSIGTDEAITFKTAFSQLLLISSKHYEDQRITQHIREVDPNDFEFQTVFREILSALQNDRCRIIVTLDNIDRLPVNEILDTWAMVRSVFSEGYQQGNSESRRTVTAVVPYDRALIEGAIENTGSNSDKNDKISDISKRELFSKTFNEILYVPPPVMSNSREFFIERIQKALPRLDLKDDVYRAYEIFGKILRQSNRTATPRQIVSFINELSGLYALHQGRFKLPTVAAYIAYQDALEHNPFSLNEQGFVDDRIRAMANDPALDKNLAAMLFNVDPELAFQILLDDKIAESLVSDNSNRLIELSRSAGFDLRIRDVILDRIDEFIRGDELSICVGNCVDLIDGYTGKSRAIIIETLVDAFGRTESLRIAPAAYKPYLLLLGHSDEFSRRKLADGIVAKAVAWLHKQETLTDADGEAFAGLLADLADSLASENMAEYLPDAISGNDLPPDVNFLIGFSSTSAEKEFGINNFKSTPLRLPEGEDNPLVAVALDQPSKALSAYSEFAKNDLLSVEQLTAIAEAVAERLREAKLDELQQFNRHIFLLSNVWVWMPNGQRDKISFSNIFSSAPFYEALKASNSDMETAEGLPYALFLAKAEFGEDNISPPEVRQGNNIVRPTETPEFQWFAKYLKGESLLDHRKYYEIGKQVRRAMQVTRWLDWSAAEPDDLFLNGVVAEILRNAPAPGISLSTFMKNYGHISNILGEEFGTFIGNYGDTNQAKKVDGVTIQNCPEGMISATKQSGKRGWQPFHGKISAVVNLKPPAEWGAAFIEGGHELHILLEAINALGLIIGEPEFRSTVIDFMVGVINGDIEPADSRLNYDFLLDAIGPDFLGEIIRQMREKLEDVDGGHLELAGRAFPKTLEKLVVYGERISQSEKDAIVRRLLCPALEANDVGTLNIFLALGRPKVSDYLEKSEDSTKSLVDGALKVFGNRQEDRQFASRVIELITGKARAKSWFDIFWPSKETDAAE